jgi:hypothetical protein
MASETTFRFFVQMLSGGTGVPIRRFRQSSVVLGDTRRSSDGQSRCQAPDPRLAIRSEASGRQTPCLSLENSKSVAAANFPSCMTGHNILRREYNDWISSQKCRGQHDRFIGLITRRWQVNKTFLANSVTTVDEQHRQNPIRGISRIHERWPVG